MLANSGQDPVPGTRWGAGGMLANSGQDPVPGTRWGAGGGDASKLWARSGARTGARHPLGSRGGC
jgi:hypothetical protein